MPLAATLVALSLITNPQIEFKATREVKPNLYEVRLAWPVFSPNTGINALANDNVGDSVYQHVVEFRLGALELDEPLTAPWDHQVGCTVSLATPTLISVLIDTYDYSGGAHPNTWTETVNVGIVNGKPKSLLIKDILTKKTTEQSFLNTLVLPRINAQRQKRSGEGVQTLPEDTNKKFIISKNGLTFLFDKYSVASYAEGEFVVKLTWKDMAGLIDTNVVSFASP